MWDSILDTRLIKSKTWLTWYAMNDNKLAYDTYGWYHDTYMIFIYKNDINDR